ncbi:MAG: hypothetical protein HC927_13940 [Deltaproteobacteria bacterium]|nr:hypothetical protein [Deltaproteobacteria bacterium]
MPSQFHQGFISLFRLRIDLVLRLATLARVPLAETDVTKWREVSNEFNDPGGRGAVFHSDFVLAAFDRPPPPDAPPESLIGLPALEALFVESQFRKDPRKPRATLVYRAGVRCRHDCPNWGLLVSPDLGVIEWADTRMFEREPELRLRRIGPDDVDVILDPAVAQIDPGWTALTAALHARGPHALEAARLAIRAARGLPLEQRQCYTTLVIEGLENDDMTELIQQLPADDHDIIPEFVRTSGVFNWGIREGLEQGRRADLMLLLHERQLDPTEEQRATIEACTNPERLQRWLLAALRVHSVAELLATE